MNFWTLLFITQMVALNSHHYFESKHNFKTNVHSQMEWSVEIIEEPVEMCTFKTEAPARCIRGRRPYSFPTIKLKGYEVRIVVLLLFKRIHE